jgi:predicted glycoside hydrolase/deacetylase ChbG (UPF0249 family)
MKLIINSDDFGLTPGVNLGIIDALKRGILRSTTAMMNMPAIEMAADLAKQNPELGVGIHLVLTAGKPLLNTHKTIVDENGNFLKNAILIKKMDVDVEEVYAEYVAQMEKYIKTFGHLPTHIDGHHHTHAIPQTVEATRRLAKTYNIKYVRHVDTEVAFIHDFYGPNTDFNQFEKVLKQHANAEYVELMCHVAFIDVDLIQCSTYNFDRVRELETLVSSKAKDYLLANNIELINFSSY